MQSSLTSSVDELSRALDASKEETKVGAGLLFLFITHPRAAFVSATFVSMRQGPCKACV